MGQGGRKRNKARDKQITSPHLLSRERKVFIQIRKRKFSKKDLSEEDVREIIEKYTKEEFTIKKFEVDKNTGELTVIIKFEDQEKASEFVRKVYQDKRADDGISYLRATTEYETSFSLTVYPGILTFFM